MTQMQSTEQRFTVVGKDLMSDRWTRITGTQAECETWAAQRAFILGVVEPVPPTIISATYLIEFGQTPRAGVLTWLANWKALLNQATPIPGLPIPVEVLADSTETGRMLVRVLAPNPDAVVARARELADGEGPKVQPF